MQVLVSIAGTCINCRYLYLFQVLVLCRYLHCMYFWYLCHLMVPKRFRARYFYQKSLSQWRPTLTHFIHFSSSYYFKLMTSNASGTSHPVLLDLWSADHWSSAAILSGVPQARPKIYLILIKEMWKQKDVVSFSIIFHSSH